MKNQEASPPVLLVSLALLLAGAACGTREPATEAERLAYGRAIIARMSEQLGAAKAFSVTTEETRVENDAKGQPQTVRLSRETVVRRPDRLYSRITKPTASAARPTTNACPPATGSSCSDDRWRHVRQRSS
jgi:hypothetical protein